MNRRTVWLIALAIAASGCTAIAANALKGAADKVSQIKLTNDLKAHAVRSIKTVNINRVAVMPLAEASPPAAAQVADGGPEAITAELYAQAATAGGWEVVPMEDVVKSVQAMPPITQATLDDDALKLAHDTGADGVIYGYVTRYQERVGYDLAASQPASVGFSLRFVDAATKQIVWTAEFSRTQKALSENMFDLANFVQRSGRWVRAHEIALEGATEAVASLHGDLNLQKDIRHFETGSYGQLKSGRQRYDSGVQGIN
jgi:curli biogenesis system outer membrane secretion channel CsgG